MATINLDIDTDSSIDPNNLDLEWREQSHLFSLYAREYANKIKVKKETFGRLYREFKENWNDRIDGKFSESAIRNKIDSSPDYIQAEYEVIVWENNVKAMDMKKYALQDLTKLAGMNFFSIPQEPRSLDRVFEKRIIKEQEKMKEQEVRERIKNKMRRIQ